MALLPFWPEQLGLALPLPLVTSASENNLGEGSPLHLWLVTFLTVFVAEMGDKTQLATLLLSAQSQSPWAIFFGSASALVTASLLSVLLGGWLGQVIPAAWVEWAAGVGFLMIGVYVLWREWQSARLERNVVNRENGSPASSFSPRQIANRATLVSFASILLAEMGDKTQLATLLLSARSQDLTVIFCGAAAALISASFLGVWAGAWVAQLIPPRWMRTLAGVGFVLIGLGLLGESLAAGG